MTSTTSTMQHRRQIHFDLGESSSSSSEPQLTAYAWELRGNVACLVPQNNAVSAPIHAALRRQDGLVEFCADAALPPTILSAFLMNLSSNTMRNVQRLRLSGHLSAASVPALCHVMQQTCGSSTLQSLECAYSNLPVSLLKRVADNLSLVDSSSSSALTHVQILSTSLTSQEQVQALCQAMDKLPHVHDLTLEEGVPQRGKPNDAKDVLLTTLLQHDFQGLRTISVPHELFCQEQWKHALAAFKSHSGTTLQRLEIRQTLSLNATTTTPMDTFDAFRQCLPAHAFLASVVVVDDDDKDEAWQVEWILPGGLRVCLVFDIVLEDEN